MQFFSQYMAYVHCLFQQYDDDEEEDDDYCASLAYHISPDYCFSSFILFSIALNCAADSFISKLTLKIKIFIQICGKKEKWMSLGLIIIHEHNADAYPMASNLTYSKPVHMPTQHVASHLSISWKHVQNSMKIIHCVSFV